MVSSVDGIIAKKDNSVSWFETSDYYEKGVEVSEQDTEGHQSDLTITFILLKDLLFIYQ